MRRPPACSFGSVANFGHICYCQLCLPSSVNKSVEQVSNMISFKGCHFPKHVILHAVYFYLRYSVSLRELEEILEERSVAVDHATLNRWVVKTHPSLHWRRKGGSSRRPFPGEWMRLISKFGASGCTSIAPSIVMAKPLILCCPNAEIRLPLLCSSRRHCQTMAFHCGS